MTKQVRDWQGDMEMCEKSKANGFSDGLSFLTILPEIGIYWLQQYAAEKARAEAAETREKKLREGIEKAMDHIGRGNYNRAFYCLEEVFYPEERTK